jgi:hypothetical protein
MVALVTEMLALHEKLAATNTAHAKTGPERQIAATDSQIDRLVYDWCAPTAADYRYPRKALRCPTFAYVQGFPTNA